jgi:hypothetical protein
VRLKGGNSVRLRVKVLWEHQVYVAEESRFGLKAGTETYHVPRGAVLVRNARADRGDERAFAVYGAGIFDALRAQGSHMPDAMDRSEERARELIVDLDGAIERGSGLRVAVSSPEEYRRRDEEVADIARRLGGDRHPAKVAAKHAAESGMGHKDRLGRVNLSAREGFLWRTRRCLEAFVDAQREVREGVSDRYRVLAGVAAGVWSEKTVFEQAVLEEYRRTLPGSRLSLERAARSIDRLEGIARRMRTLSVAPFGRYGFPRAAECLEDAVASLRAKRGPDAHAALDRARRSFLMMDARVFGEEMYTVASRAEKAGVRPEPADIDAIDADLDAFRALFIENGRPIDHGFSGQFVVSRVLPAIAEVRAGARSLFGYSAEAVRAGLAKANAFL